MASAEIRAEPNLRGRPQLRGGLPADRSAVTCVVHVPSVVEQDEGGVWCASAQLRPGVGAVGDGPTAEAAVVGLRDALERCSPRSALRMS
jgi:hypothetical protein